MGEKQGYTFASPWTAQWDDESADWVVWGSVSEPDETGMTWQPTICSLSDCVGEDEARLIAAAPDLLAALSDLLPPTLCGESWDLPEHDAVPITITFGKLNAARAAISRATGEDSPANEGEGV